MRESAQTVIVGAGVVGASLAYHLARLGRRDILVIDKGPWLDTGGSTYHAPGGVLQNSSSKLMAKAAQYTVELFRDATHRGERIVYQVGSLEVATTPRRMTELHRRRTSATSFGLEARLLSPEESAQLQILIDPGSILGSLHVPSDARVVPALMTAALAEWSGDAVEYLLETPVTDLLVERDRCVGVMTGRGPIRADEVVLATNVWGNALLGRLGIRYPLMAAEHLLTFSEPLDELAADRDTYCRMPMMRNQDMSMYMTQHYDSMNVGSYRHASILHESERVGDRAESPFTPEHFDVARKEAARILPALEGKGIARAINGYMAFTADNTSILGETSMPGLHVCLAAWITHAGGIGKTMAEWMTSGTTEWPWHEVWSRRFVGHEHTPAFYRHMVDRSYQQVYDILHPLVQPEHPRDVRTAPYHDRLLDLGGHCFTAAGWEVPQWYAANERLLDRYDARIPHRTGWEAENWSRLQGAEHLALRDGVGVFPISHFAQIEVSGPGALTWLQTMCAGNVDRAIGRIVYTAMLNGGGGFMSDLTVTRIAPDRWMVVTGAGGAPRDLAWLSRHLPEDGSVTVADVGSAWSGVALWGPKARHVLERVAAGDVSNAAFPYFRARRMDVGPVPCLLMRLSYAGELGWEMSCPTEYGRLLWDTIWEAGQEDDVFPLGSGAFNSLRIEKGYRATGTELTSDRTPLEAGLDFAVDFDSGPFCGRDALERQRSQGVTRKLACLVSEDPGAMALGKEPILRDGRALGYVTGADFGYSVGRFIAYGYLPHDDARPGTNVEVHYLDRRFAMTVDADPQFDPGMERLRA